MSSRTLLCYGDSNTYGTPPMAALGEMRRFSADERWPGILAATLGSRWRVIDEGLPGRTTVHPDPIAGRYKNGLAVLPAILESHAPLDLVVLMLGTNDLKARFAVPAVEIADSVAKLMLCVRQSFAGPGGAAPQVLLVCPPPVIEAGCLADIFAGGAAKSSMLAWHYAAVAQRFGTAYLDAGPLVGSSTLDGVHLDPAAHRTLGLAVAAHVASMQF